MGVSHWSKNRVCALHLIKSNFKVFHIYVQATPGALHLSKGHPYRPFNPYSFPIFKNNIINFWIFNITPTFQEFLFTRRVSEIPDDPHNACTTTAKKRKSPNQSRKNIFDRKKATTKETLYKNSRKRIKAVHHFSITFCSFFPPQRNGRDFFLFHWCQLVTPSLQTLHIPFNIFSL